MEITARPARREPRYARALSRSGDGMLFALWAIQGVASCVRAKRLLDSGDTLAGIHVAMVAAVLFVMGTLFLVRGSAVRKSQGFAPKLVAIVGTWSIFLVAAQPLTWRPNWLLTAVTAALICAYAFVIWAVLALRKNLSIYPEARQLVRHGPYALVRHPLYAAHITCYALICLPRMAPLTLVIGAIGISAEVLRARNEEQVLQATFGEYRDYAAVTPRFVPRWDALLPRLNRAARDVNVAFPQQVQGR